MDLRHLLITIVTAAAAHGEPRQTIIIDPGHEPWSMKDHWVKSGEAGANLKFAKALEQRIRQEDKYDVLVTLDEKGYHPLLIGFEKKNRRRVAGIRRAYVENKEQGFQSSYYYQMLHARALFFQPEYKTYNADLFVSVHHNEPGGKNRKLHGFCIYYSTTGSHGRQSKALAETIRETLLANHYARSTNGGEKTGIAMMDFTVLHHANKHVPAVLMELGYISNAQDKKDAYDAAKVEKKAHVVYSALDSFLSRRR